jgi:hypothetical protein
MSVRAKFRVDHNGPIQGQEGAEQHDVIMHAVTDGGPEDHEFWKWTPAGELRLSTINPAAWEQLEVGKAYYIDITPAE